MAPICEKTEADNIAEAVKCMMDTLRFKTATCQGGRIK